MLRREAGDWWVLISQVEHARLAHQLAIISQVEPKLMAFSLTRARGFGIEEIPFHLWLEAVRHHDDGWREWEQAPDLNAEGMPRAFDEMRMEVSTGIWEQSITSCAEKSPCEGLSVSWEGLWVSRHFCFLAERALEHLPEGVSASAARGFLERQTREQEGWRRELVRGYEDDQAIIEDWGYRHLQFFDRLSLWVCLSLAGDERTLELPEGGELRLLRTGKNVIEVSKGFLREDVLPFQVAAKRVRKDAFHDEVGWNEACQGAEKITLEWVVKGNEALNAK